MRFPADLLRVVLSSTNLPRVLHHSKDVHINSCQIVDNWKKNTIFITTGINICIYHLLRLYDPCRFWQVKSAVLLVLWLRGSLHIQTSTCGCRASHILRGALVPSCVYCSRSRQVQGWTTTRINGDAHSCIFHHCYAILKPIVDLLFSRPFLTLLWLNTKLLNKLEKE